MEIDILIPIFKDIVTVFWEQDSIDDKNYLELLNKIDKLKSGGK